MQAENAVYEREMPIIDMNGEAYTVHMGPAPCAVDLGDGSERGEYVCQDYILNQLGRPHRSINLMYCYYPLDEGWPTRASLLGNNQGVSFAWDYPYDDYFPYEGGIGGNTGGEPFNSMKDVRRHGQDVTLTLTVDCAVPDEHLVRIAQELRPYGRMMLRINHEATGDWFAFNKRYSYQEVADFFVRFHNIIKSEAPNIRTILCIGEEPEKETGKMKYEDEFSEAIRVADIWSGDYYLALNWGWPFTVAERGGKTHKRSHARDIYNANRGSYERFCIVNGGSSKPLVISELNADGDVTGPYEQAQMMKDFYCMVRDEKAAWLTGITCYQFRDRGRLGLELEDPNCPTVGIRQPLFDVYKEIIKDPYFQPSMKYGGQLRCPARLRWGGSEDADGLAMPLRFDKNPVFCEVMFDDENLNAMIELNGKWFYKKPGAKTIDLMPAFYENPLRGPCELMFKLFAPPGEGVNDPSQGADWAENYYTVINNLPKFRIRYEPIELSRYTP
ncbi:MAG: hypothetical protein ACM3XR_12380 [Bacillota bacterium]